MTLRRLSDGLEGSTRRPRSVREVARRRELYEGIRQPMTFRARYLLIGGPALAAAVGLIGWNFFGGRSEVLKPDGGRVVTVMDFG
jgi:hypothetical protein